MAITKSNKHKLSLDHDKPNEKGGCTFATLDLINEGSLWDSQISITSLDLALLGTLKGVSQLLE